MWSNKNGISQPIYFAVSLSPSCHYILFLRKIMIIITVMIIPVMPADMKGRFAFWFSMPNQAVCGIG